MLTHIWCCTCGEETECTPDDLVAGAVWHCDSCDTTFGCVRSKRGSKEWIKIDAAQVAFRSLLDDDKSKDF